MDKTGLATNGTARLRGPISRVPFLSAWDGRLRISPNNMGCRLHSCLKPLEAAGGRGTPGREVHMAELVQWDGPLDGRYKISSVF